MPSNWREIPQRQGCANWYHYNTLRRLKIFNVHDLVNVIVRRGTFLAILENHVQTVTYAAFRRNQSFALLCRQTQHTKALPELPNSSQFTPTQAALSWVRNALKSISLFISLPLFDHILLDQYRRGEDGGMIHACSTKRLHLVAGAVPVCVALSLLATAPAGLTGAIVVALAVLVATAGALLATDWHADAESQRAWAHMAPACAQWRPDVQQEQADIETGYRPASDSDVLREILRRRALSPTPATTVEASSAARSASSPTSTRCLPAPVAREGGRELACINLGVAGIGRPVGPFHEPTRGEPEARPAKTIATGRRQSLRAVSARRRLVVNAGSHWPGLDRNARKPSATNGIGTVIVLSERRDPRTARPIDAGKEIAPGQEPQQGRCRRRRSLKARVAERHAALEARRRTRGAAIKAHHGHRPRAIARYRSRGGPLPGPADPHHRGGAEHGCDVLGQRAGRDPGPKFAGTGSEPDWPSGGREQGR